MEIKIRDMTGDIEYVNRAESHGESFYLSATSAQHVFLFLSLVVNPGPNWPRMIEMLDATASEKRKQFAFLPVWFTLSHHNLYLVHGHVF